ncbi:MAG: cytidine deaminase [Christensenellaceae bacterium]|nr:cytidine deaminase [Christensenellaceae bacterium]
MLIELTVEVSGAPEDIGQLLDDVAAACGRAEGIEPCGAAGRLVDDRTIHEVNRAFRGIDRPTVVLSFPWVAYPRGRTARDCRKLFRRERNPETGRVHLGDFMISLERAQAQAHSFGHSLARELAYLTAHSMFHLMGDDHEDEGERAAMRALEERALNDLNLTRERGANMCDQELFERAVRALGNAYVPYSHYPVGASLLAADGRVFDGCNVENASYGATICAERTAVASAVCQGAKSFTAIAIAGARDQSWPCGICRQVLREFAPDIRVICGNAETGRYDVTTLRELLPRSFGPENLA